MADTIETSMVLKLRKPISGLADLGGAQAERAHGAPTGRVFACHHGPGVHGDAAADECRHPHPRPRARSASATFRRRSIFRPFRARLDADARLE